MRFVKITTDSLQNSLDLNPDQRPFSDLQSYALTTEPLVIRYKQLFD